MSQRDPFPPVPTHISDPAREHLLKPAVESDGDPQSPEDWARFREAEEKDAIAFARKMQSQWGFDQEAKLIEGVRAIEVTPSESTTIPGENLILYLHGGGYTVTNADQCAWLVAGVTRLLGIPALAVDYRNAPEFPFPCALDDAFAVYQWLVERIEPSRICVFGDSAGGGLALATILRARDEGVSLPAALGLLSPWTDIDKVGDTYFTLQGIDPRLDYDLNLKSSRDAYVGEQDSKNPYISPVYGDYSGGFPPVLMVSGTRDMFLSNCARMQEVLMRAGVETQLVVREAMDHGVGTWPPLPEGEDTYRFVADFFRRHLTS